MNRRNFVEILPSLALFDSLNFVGNTQYPIASNGYNWITFYAREGKNWGNNLEDDFTQYTKTGIKAYEPGISDLQHAIKLVNILPKFNISMPSAYVNSLLHDKDKTEESINSVIEIAKVLSKFGTKILVTNPSPIKWGNKDVKSDEQLLVQASSLEKLNQKLKKMGITLAYHTHDMEMLAGAREFHHMMQNTKVAFCMDVHWIYRGSQNSQVAVFDILKMYGKRIVELHLRQSKNGIWNETFSAEGDIDYNKLAREIKKLGIKPHLVIEQCLEDKTEKNIDVISAHIKDLIQVKNTFK